MQPGAIKGLTGAYKQPQIPRATTGDNNSSIFHLKVALQE